MGSTEAERPFSCIQRSHTWFSNTMTTKRPSGLAVIAMHPNAVTIDRSVVCEKFVALHPRQITASTLLADWVSKVSSSSSSASSASSSSSSSSSSNFHRELLCLSQQWLVLAPSSGAFQYQRCLHKGSYFTREKRSLHHTDTLCRMYHNIAYS